ncbi:hypothetical protein PMI17_02317 [Pantoea sp. GM01]|nr:hypothetical protein PMI17_02317 [Pantoea sp. GM01]
MTVEGFGNGDTLIFQAAVSRAFIIALNQQTRLPFTLSDFALDLNLRQRFLQLVQNFQRRMTIVAEQTQHHKISSMNAIRSFLTLNFTRMFN